MITRPKSPMRTWTCWECKLYRPGGLTTTDTFCTPFVSAPPFLIFLLILLPLLNPHALAANHTVSYRTEHTSVSFLQSVPAGHVRCFRDFVPVWLRSLFRPCRGLVWLVKVCKALPKVAKILRTPGLPGFAGVVRGRNSPAFPGFVQGLQNRQCGNVSQTWGRCPGTGMRGRGPGWL